MKDSDKKEIVIRDANLEKLEQKLDELGYETARVVNPNGDGNYYMTKNKETGRWDVFKVHEDHEEWKYQ